MSRLSPLRLLIRGLVLPMWQALQLFPSRLLEREFWGIQASIAVVTGLHFTAEAILVDAPWWGLHHLPVILYMLPIAWGSIRYGWEGGLLTSAWISLLVVPSIMVWHLENWMWLGELARVVVVVAVGVTLTSRVEREARARGRAEASEARFRSLFEAAGDAILVYDQHGVIVAANAATVPFFGVAEPRLLQGQHVDTLVPSWKRPVSQSVSRNNAARDGPTRVVAVRADGGSLMAEAVVSALRDGSGEALFQAVLRDATAQETRERGLRSLVQQVTQAQEEERERIARELHDDTLQALVLLGRELESIADIPGMIEEGRVRLTRMASLTTSSGEGLRRFSRDLRPSILNDLGLAPAIEWQTEDLAKRASLDARFRTEGVTRRLSRHVELALFRIAQEALRNVEKHSHATKVEAVLFFEPSRVTLTVTDNGVGFSPPSTLEELVPTGKLGLVGLKERVSLLGGTIQLHAAPGQGTKLSVEIPEEG